LDFSYFFAFSSAISSMLPFSKIQQIHLSITRWPYWSCTPSHFIWPSCSPNPLVDVWKSGGFLNENSVRGHLSKLQAGTIQNGDVIWKINRYKPFSPGARKMCRCGPFRLNSLGVIDICHNTWNISFT